MEKTRKLLCIGRNVTELNETATVLLVNNATTEHARAEERLVVPQLRRRHVLCPLVSVLLKGRALLQRTRTRLPADERTRY